VRAGAQGIGFAIPVDKAMSVAGKLLSVERVEHKWHGVKFVDNPTRKTAVIASIDDDSPAAKCGLKVGDVISSADDKPITRSVEFERALLGRQVGQDIPITVRRSNESIHMSLALADAPQKSVSDPTWELLGLKLQVIPQQQFQQYQSRYHGGLTVLAVRP